MARPTTTSSRMVPAGVAGLVLGLVIGSLVQGGASGRIRHNVQNGPVVANDVQCPVSRGGEASTHGELQVPSRRAKGFAAAAIALHLFLIVLLIIGIVKAYQVFVEVAAVPAPREDPGEVYLYFDRPGVAAYLEARISDLDYRGTDLEYSVEVDATVERPVRYFLVLTGDASTEELYPNGEPFPRTDGCWSSVSVFPDNQLSCKSAPLARGTGYSRPEEHQPTQAVTGVIDNDQYGPVLRAKVSTMARGEYSVTAGKRRYFGLPAIGTSFVPEGFRADIAADLGDGVQAYVPSKLDVGIDYGKLSTTDRLESVAPDPLPGLLAWVKTDTSLLQACGSIVNTVDEENGQRTLFLLAVFAGAASTILPLLVSGVFRAFGRLRSNRRR